MRFRPLSKQQGYLGIGLGVIGRRNGTAAPGAATGFFLLANGTDVFLLADGTSKLQVVS